MAKKVRVYELARELGISNKDALDLCVSLGIGAKSHSSSIEEAQADRVRRKADAEGLRREPITSSETGKADADSPAVPSSIKRGAGSSKSEQAQIGDLQEVASSSAQSGTRVIKSSSPGVRTARITSAKPSEAQSRSISMTRPPSGVPSQAEPQQSP
ncbi:MAG TPA: translation initiation factor IF-2 N-terminal domain-containing protein, partial [Acidimicrobiales bacterium]|nr:translation initiation factor IF-2 N-terminal domain-containing protein [Acidimicrobiales bacterium]